MDVYPNSLDLVQEAVAGYFVINIEFECVKLHRSIMSTELQKMDKRVDKDVLYILLLSCVLRFASYWDLMSKNDSTSDYRATKLNFATNLRADGLQCTLKPPLLLSLSFGSMPPSVFKVDRFNIINN